jgi:hypothetical protein
MFIKWSLYKIQEKGNIEWICDFSSSPFERSEYWKIANFIIGTWLTLQSSSFRSLFEYSLFILRTASECIIFKNWSSWIYVSN